MNIDLDKIIADNIGDSGMSKSSEELNEFPFSFDMVKDIAKEYADLVIKETIEVADAHCDNGHFDKEGALVNSLNIIK